MTYLRNDRAQQDWNIARPIRGKNPNLFRRDSLGNVIYKPAYGMNSSIGWEIDHIFPKSKGGSDSRKNLQALQTKANRQKSNTMPRRGKISFRQRRH